MKHYGRSYAYMSQIHFYNTIIVWDFSNSLYELYGRIISLFLFRHSV